MFIVFYRFAAKNKHETPVQTYLYLCTFVFSGNEKLIANPVCVLIVDKLNLHKNEVLTSFGW